MSTQNKAETWLEANECAARIGLSKRALRLYEERGLIRPRRTDKGWRLYGADEIARLHEILALKRLGLSLQRITALLHGKALDLSGELLEQQQRGGMSFELLSEELAELVREQQPIVNAELEAKGGLQSLGLRRVAEDGVDIYEAQFAQGSLQCGIGFGQDGRVHTLWMLPA
ncbi:hypothetical protein B6S44_11145 [Bosea sp. Tri-44]|uniref:MerR family transcriptional regulator n=1 Tax=Bosea sp. Tri-44 TaxID=1972137 RepID=UPI00100E7F4F|nr:MerR family transcriptional regulator [Bosea sp. Tri-44]RXT55162.1 hypothetical protein B6S44_11145 [Bosea sp. Tri-44]